MAQLQELLLSWRSESKTFTQTKIPQTSDEVENQESRMVMKDESLGVSVGITILEGPFAKRTIKGEGAGFMKETQETDASLTIVPSPLLQDQDHPLSTTQEQSFQQENHRLLLWVTAQPSSPALVQAP